MAKYLSYPPVTRNILLFAIGILLLATLPAVHAGLTDTIISYWNFNTGSGGIDVDQLNRNNASVLSTAWTTQGFMSGAINASKGSGFQQAANLSTNYGISNFTMSMWVNDTNWSNFGSGQALFGNWLTTNVVAFRKTGIRTLTLYTVNSSTATTTMTCGIDSYFNNHWAHILITYNSSKMSMWINGTRCNSTAVTGPLKATALKWYLFADDNTIAAINGTIDEVGIWNRTLTDTEIGTLYNGGNGISYPFSTSSNLTIRVNDTRINTLVAGFSWNYTTSNTSDTNSKSGYCNVATGCSITNYSGTLNVTAFNVSGGTYFNPSINISATYDSSIGGTITFYTYQNSLQANLTNAVNNSAIGGFCVNISNSTTSQSNCTSAGSIAFYGVGGNTTLLYYNVSNGAYFNVTQNIGVFNATLMNYTNSTYQSVLQINATQLYTMLGIGTFNITNWLLANQTTAGQLTIRANTGANNVKIDVPGNYSLNATCTGTVLSISPCNITGVYDGLFKINATDILNNTAISNFTINAVNTTLFDSNYTTTNGSVYIPLLRQYYYSFIINASGYALRNATPQSNATQNNYTFSVYRAQTVNITFRDEVTNTIITTTNITIELISNTSSYNYTTANGTLFVDLLFPDTYNIRYGADNYTTRFYSLTIASQSFNVLNLTLCPDTICSAVTISVKDQFDNALEGAIIKVLKYDILQNGYVLQEVLTTNFDGETESNIQINNEYYKFIIEYEGVTVLSTLPTYVYGSTLTFVVNIGATGFEDYFYGIYLTGFITKISDAVYSFTWSDTQNTATQGCLYAYRESHNATTLYNSSCVSSAAGTTFVTIDNSTGTSYTLYGRVTKYSIVHTLDSEIITFQQRLPNSGGIDLFILFILLLAIVFVGVWSPTIGVILVGVTPFLLSLTGIVNISVGVASVVLILSIIIAYIVNR